MITWKKYKYIEETMNWKWNIKYNQEFTNLAFDSNKVYIEWKIVELSEIWNFLVWYNWNIAGFSEWAILASGYWVEVKNYMWQYEKDTSLSIVHEAAMLDEIVDIPWYQAGYSYADNEWKNNFSLAWAFKNGNTMSDITAALVQDKKNILDKKYSTKYSNQNLVHNEY